MDEDNNLRRHFRRRGRRRADRALQNLLEVQRLRNFALNNRPDSSGSESEESAGGVDSDSGDQNNGAEQDSGQDSVDNNTEEERDEGSEGSQEENSGQDSVVENSSGQDSAEETSGQDSDEERSDGDQDSVVEEGGANENVRNWDLNEIEQFSIQAFREWASSGGVLSMSKVDEILGRFSFVFPNIPKSYKTLLSTQIRPDIQVADEYKFWYKGIKKNLDQMILDSYLQTHNVILIDMNMDGLPLSKQRNSIKFWPILGKLVGSTDEPFKIAIYCGKKDPNDVDLYLGDLVVELVDLRNNGYTYNGQNYPVRTRNFVLDAPARSFVKCCIGHGGYGACEKCNVHGAYEADRMHFADVGPEVTARTDQTYEAGLDRLHHSGRSPLLFAGIGMVSQFPLDTMHLLYKGVFSRLLDAILTWEGPWNIPLNTIQEISQQLCDWKSSCPSDFNRKPRKLEDWYKYKATELRRLLLYDAIVAFHGKLPENVYNLLLLLHSGLYILASPYLLPRFCDDAEIFLKSFVEYSAQIFGPHFVSYNVHSLLHLADECRAYGTLEEFSAFPYENALKTLKETLRSGYLPLEQIVKRDSERVEKRQITLKSVENSVQLFKCHAENQYRKIIVNQVTFKVNSSKDGCFMTRNGEVVVLENIINERNEVTFVGKQFMDNDNFYTYPVDSSQLGIFKVWNLGNVCQQFSLNDVFCKCWIIEDGNTFVSIPLLHSSPLLF